jgi:hypothetical protein
MASKTVPLFIHNDSTMADGDEFWMNPSTQAGGVDEGGSKLAATTTPEPEEVAAVGSYSSIAAA